MTSDSQNQRIPHNIRVLGFVSLFQDAASEMIYPFIPLFFVTVLGAPAIALGFTDGFAEALGAFAKIWTGRHADVHKRRPIIAFGYELSAVAKLSFSLATIWPFAAVSRAGDRLGKGIRTSPRDAVIADEVPKENRGKAFGFHRALDTTGAVIGPIIGLILFRTFHFTIRTLFVVCFIPGAISVGLILFVHEKRRNVESSKQEHFTASFSPDLKRLIFLMACFAAINFSDLLLLLRVHQLGFSQTGVVAVYCLYNTTYALLSYPGGHLSDKIGRKATFLIGLLVFCVVYFALGITTSHRAVWFLFALYGCYTALTDGVGKAWISDLAPVTHRASALGVYSAVGGIGALIAGLWAGALWGTNGHFPTIIAGIAGAVLVICFTLFSSNKNREENKATV